MDAFGIFEGGGVKGLAHIGALAAAQQRGVNFKGVAGTSAGAIVAALVAVGYEADELYNPNSPGNRGIFDVSYLEFIDKGAWNDLRKTINHAYRSFSHGVVTDPRKRKTLTLAGKALWFYLRRSKTLNQLSSKRGVLTSKKFSDWLEPLLSSKIQEKCPEWRGELSAPDSKVQFRHIPLPLKIIATDLTNQCFKVFSMEESPNQSVAEAVAASISIPFLFMPVSCDEVTHAVELVDGGLLSNFPAWVFDRERQASPLIQTFGFKFVAVPDPDASGDAGILRFTQNLVLTALSGDDHLQSRQIDNLHIVPLKVTTKTLQFDLERDDRDELYEKGKNCARDAFIEFVGWISPEDPTMGTLFSALHAKLQQAIGKKVRLRLCVFLPHGVFKDRLKIQYTFNFHEEDADDQMELPIGAGIAGKCWETRRAVAADMEIIRSTFRSDWKMTKYQQALVRRELKSCLCLPILKNGNKPIGIFSIDSDDDLVAEFQKSESSNKVVDEALECAQLIQNLIRY